MNILYITHPLNGVLMIGVALVTGYVLIRRYKLNWGLWWAGGLTFILSQTAHIPFNLVFLNPFLTTINNSFLSNVQAAIISAILLGLSAGVFEEVARYAAYRWWQKDTRNWTKAMLFGAGHGGIEAIILGFLVLFTFLQMITLRSSDLSSIIPAEDVSLVQGQINIYWSVAWYLPLLGALERIFTIPFHISASVLVLQTFTRGKGRWLWLAIGWHTLIDALVVFVANQWGIFLAEGLLGILTLISLGIIYFFRESLEEPEEELPPLESPISLDMLKTIEISKEKIESTRYN